MGKTGRVCQALKREIELIDSGTPSSYATRWGVVAGVGGVFVLLCGGERK